MPELPDVVGLKRYLDATSLHQRIASTQCLDGLFVKATSGIPAMTLEMSSPRALASMGKVIKPEMFVAQ